ncbi:glycosyltransferase family 4 protein [Algoriphagus sp.]|uniref:glycosyltransferase family 4 protein n=2 Tax=Algoriphagus sp. TaxID=1872435 RepID=UPI00327B8202
MHICFITSEYPKIGFHHGGVGTFIQTLARNLVKNKFQVSIVGLNYSDKHEEEEDMGVKVYRLKPKRMKPITWYLTFRSINQQINKINRKQPIDVVEATELGLAFIKKIPSISYIIRMNGGHHFFSESENRGIDPWKGFQEKRSFAQADVVIGVSNYVVNHTLTYLDFAKKKGPVLYNPANLANFYEADPEKIIPGRLFFAGTVCEKKGIRQLIQALPLIRKEFPDAHLLVAGRDWFFPDGSSYIDYLKSNFVPDELSPYITFLGPVDNQKLPAYIEEAELCIYPSHMEAMPLAWIEVLSMGKSFLASNVGPGPEVVTDGVTGRLCDPYSPEDIAQKAIQMLANPEESRKFGQKAREDVLKRFDIKVLVEQNIKFYQSLKKSPAHQ